MPKPLRLITVFLCIIAFSGLVIGLQSAKADDTSAFFSDHFDGSAVDASKWQVYEQNINMTDYPAWGGSVQVANGSLYMSSNGSTFPFMQSVQNPFPTSGDFAIQFNLTYTAIGDWGCGLMMGNGTPTLEHPSMSWPPFGPVGGDVWHNRVFTLWAGDKGSESDTHIYIEMFNSLVYEMDYPGFKPSSPSHLYKLAYAQGIYHVFVDGFEVAQVASIVRPTTIVLGHPPIYHLPNPPEATAEWAYWGWNSFKLDYIVMLQPPQISLSINTKQPQLGNKVNICGNLTDANGIPISNQTMDILYTVAGISSWYPLAAATTDINGFYSTTWLPNANSEFNLKASWSGNDVYMSASAEQNMSVLSDQSDNTFFAESNSTLSSLAFNATSREISFSVSGPSETTGYVRFVIPKTMLPSLTDFKVYMDGQEVNFTASTVGDSQVLYFVYHHSSHIVVLRMPVSTTPEFPFWGPLLLCLALSIVIVALKKKTYVLGR